MSDITERLRWDKRYTNGHVPVTMEDAAKEIERLRARVREAFRAGFGAWWGPANDQEFEEGVKEEQKSWEEWIAEQGANDMPAERHANTLTTKLYQGTTGSKT